MKKFLMISALSTLFPSSIIICSERNNPNKAYKNAGLVILGGLAVYGMYRYTRQNTPPSSSNDLPQSEQKDKQKPSLSEQLMNTQTSNPEKPTKNNNATDNEQPEKPQINNNKIASPEPTTAKKPSNGNTLHEQTTKAVLTTEPQISFSDALRIRFKENDIKKLLMDASLTDHAFSN